MNKPNISNLRKRAKVFGMIVTKAWDASISGHCEYVLHFPGDDWENMAMTSLWGVQAAIERMEKTL
jgi:hypothetical protein